MNELIIGVTDCSKFDLYDTWIKSDSDHIKTIKLSPYDASISKLSLCHGILLTGGEDVHPKFYNMPERLPYCYEDDISVERDELELKVLAYTEKAALPVLGICRGLQIANVYFGGTLIPDIPSWGKFNHSKLHNGSDRYHEVTVDKNSNLFKCLNTTSGEINSNHHQSVEQVGKGLVASAISNDGVIEALERKDSAGTYLCLIQWHPERLIPQKSPFATQIKKAFLNACIEKKQ